MQADAQLPSRCLVFLTLVLLIIAGAFLRIHGAGIYHASPDDINHIEMAEGRTLGEVYGFSQLETHPPLGNFLRHGWISFSEAPWFLRSFSLMFGLAIIPLYYAIGAQIGGRWSGLACAVLATFSHGLMIQSYVVRNYTLFIFLLSAAYYSWLCWRKSFSGAALLSYTVFGALTVATHFSGVFGLACLGAMQAAMLLRQRAWARCAQWIAANAVVAFIASLLMVLWAPLLALTRVEIHQLAPATNWFYPLAVMDYFFIYRLDLLFSIALFLLVAYALAKAAKRFSVTRSCVLLAAIALLAGTLLIWSGAYSAGIDRRSLWLLPFMMIPFGCAIGLACARSSRPFMMLGLLLAAGGLGYSQTQRFGDVTEYMITEPDWSTYTDYLKHLDSSHLVIGSRADTFLIAYPDAENLYPLYGTAPDADRISIASYHDTRLLFKPFAYHYTGRDLVAIVRQAEKAGYLEGVDTLVFTSTRWSRATTRTLLTCPALTKTVRAFPPLPEHQPLDEALLETHPAFLLEVPKAAFLSQLVREDGIARSCLN